VTVFGEIYLEASVVAHLHLEVMFPSAVTFVIALGLAVPPSLKMDTTTEALRGGDVVLEVPVLLYPALQVDRCPRVSPLTKRN
jgi:asparagine synthetase B (glutamine-hydrolysing)